MMMQRKKPEFTAARDQDELEGALLLPTATAVNNTESNLAPGAVPTAFFDYAHDEAAEAQAEQEVIDISDVPTALMVPKYDNLKDRENAELHKTAAGQLRGIQEAEQEREQVTKAATQTYAINYHADRHVEQANLNAKKRNMHGVEIEKDTWFGKEKEHPSLAPTAPPKSEPAFAAPKDGGYEVAGYQVSDYSAGNDYEVTEYKSAYD
mmetsp:Transcript_29275/g.48388  ORF Transcript_29275/g.48388 Transcript_29275/m.48388 type:complete len:208 (+) Transcript_29275:111-734(+)|eukprot:CAMPEP_0119015432 /NCGR_PEP_ID=MMETSP1176-20130426/11007_1 /TAXON_ID=265551 /ORGANISM="Synedropsis recta cf, Strain CCMP1620" /LENGTH=207 /DNA_ID=CAMNT_0006968723 /DNA_START=82 /DNA_END=705 /DNA_ORIENTATION=+